MYLRTPTTTGALLLSRSDVERLPTPDECISAVEDEIIVFDSSGTALQDVAAAVAVFRRALEHGEGARFSFDA